jgi:hypothetical protein
VGFSVRVAPGVRVRASSRGVRTSLGPRVARVHLGAGRTGVSTGAGPFTYYTSIGGSARRSSGTAATSRELAAASTSSAAHSKVDQARELATALQRINDLHRETFPEATRPQAPVPPPVDADRIRRAYEVHAKRQTSIFARRKREDALSEARILADMEVSRLNAEYTQQREHWQADIDRAWAALRANDTDTVLVALTRAFEDNEAAAAAVGAEGDEVSLVVVVPPEDCIPERKPTTTAAGNLSLKKLTKRDTADLYKLVVAGFALVTVKEAFAVAPAITTTRVVAVRHGDRIRTPEPVMGATISRRSLRAASWDSTDAWTILQQCAGELATREKGVTKALQPLDLAQHPQLEPLLEAIDFDDLAEARARDGVA